MPRALTQAFRSKKSSSLGPMISGCSKCTGCPELLFKSLAEGAKVEYEVEQGPKGPQAQSVSVVASV